MASSSAASTSSPRTSSCSNAVRRPSPSIGDRDVYYAAVEPWAVVPLPVQALPLQSIIPLSGDVVLVGPATLRVTATAAEGETAVRIVSGWPSVEDLQAEAPGLVHAVGLLTAHYATTGRDLAITGTIAQAGPLRVRGRDRPAPVDLGRVMIAPPGVGVRPHRIRIEIPGDEIPDGEGGFVLAWTPANPPAIFVQIVPATTRELERLGASSLLAVVSHLITAPFHPQISTTSRLRFLDLQKFDHLFEVASVIQHDYRNATITIAANEVLS